MLELMIDLTLDVETALSVGAGSSSGILADKAIVRNRLNQLVLPGSHLKGRLRHACEIIARNAGHWVCDSPRAETMCPQYAAPGQAEDIAPVWEPCPICQLFGSPAYTSPLAFADLVSAEPVPIPSIRPGASVNRRRRVVEDQRLFFIETSPPGAWVHFHNPQAIHGWLPDPAAAAQTKLLLAGLNFLQNWGGGKSRGLGWGRVTVQAALDDRRITTDNLAAAIGGLR